MRIGMMCHASLGGSVRIATQLSEELARRGHRVDLFTQVPPFAGWGSAAGVVLHHVSRDGAGGHHCSSLHTEWSPDESVAFLSQVLLTIEKEGLDVLHFHYAVPFGFIAAAVKDRLGEDSPVLVGTVHGTDVSVFGCNPLKGPQLAGALRRLDSITTVSTSHAILAKNVFGLAHSPEVIPNFVDIHRFRPGDAVGAPVPAVRPAGRADGVKRARIVHASNLRPVKDLESVAHIFVGIRRRMDAQLWIVGEGPEMETVTSIVSREGYAGDLLLWGLRDDLAPILAQADLLLMPSLSESFCLAALEAMACGVPVLATNVGGLPEVVLHGKTGFLFPQSDNSMAVEMAVCLLSDPAAHAEMARTAVKHARGFDRSIVVPVYESLYSRLLSPSATAAVSAMVEAVE